MIPAMRTTSGEGSIHVWPVSTRNDASVVASASITTQKPTNRGIRERSVAADASIPDLDPPEAATLMMVVLARPLGGSLKGCPAATVVTNLSQLGRRDHKPIGARRLT